MFGPHLIIDGTRSDTRKLADRNIVEQVLNDYPAAIGMTKIGGPYMFEYQAPDPAYSGVSGLVVIAESHIAIHTFPELDYFTMDIFSCKNFDHEVAIEYIRKAFDVKEMDRMLVQRGLSFRGPHHGKQGATDALIAAAEARLKAGIISNEPALPDDAPAIPTVPTAPTAPATPAAGMLDGRLAAAARREGEPTAAAGRMIWPQYGVTPDIGTYGDGDGDVDAVTGGRRAPLGDATVARDGLPATEPVQVNPTASISGLLDKMAATGGQGRALGRALAAWERVARDGEASIVLAASAPMVAEGLRETLVYAIERRYVDTLVLGADDLFADLYESLGHEHYVDGESVAATDEGRAHTRAFFTDFLANLDIATVASAADFWRRLGEYLPTRVPRKGVLQAAARSGVRIFVPDVATSEFGTLLLAARVQGVTLSLDSSDEVVALARTLAQRPHLGTLRIGASGTGAAEAMLAQALAVAASLNLGTPEPVATVALGGNASAPADVRVAVDASLALPLLVTGLAQRLPATRTHAADAATVSEPVLA